MIGLPPDHAYLHTPSMPLSFQDAQIAMQRELVTGESIAWMGQPNPHVVFHKEDALLIPFSLMWGGFAIFWEAGVLGLWDGSRHGTWTFGIIWGIPFVLIGQYLIWGRFLYDRWLKQRTFYVVTNRRVIVMQRSWSPKIVGAYLDTLPALTKEGSDPGTLSFTPAASLFSAFSSRTSATRRRNLSGWSSVSIGDTPIFRDINNVDYVYRLISDLREKVRSRNESAPH